MDDVANDPAHELRRPLPARRGASRAGGRCAPSAAPAPGPGTPPGRQARSLGPTGGGRWAARVAAVALALSALAGPVAPGRAQDRQAPPAFADEIAAFQARDALHPPSRGGIVFTGSSSIRLWPDLAADFPGMGAINRGFGGSTIADATGHAALLVRRHRPRQVVLYAGDNDLANGLGPDQVAEDFAAFVRAVRADDPTLAIVFIAIKPSPARIALLPAQRRANARVRAMAAADPHLDYADVATAMLDDHGRPRPGLYQADGLHLTVDGYRLWRERIAPVLRRPAAGQQEPGTRPGSGIAADSGRGDRI